MKNIIRNITASALALVFVVGVYATPMHFYVQQYGSGSDEFIGDISNDNPGEYGSAYNVTYPATSVTMRFFHPWADIALYVCDVDSSAATGTYWVGYFPGGADCYANIY